MIEHPFDRIERYRGYFNVVGVRDDGYEWWLNHNKKGGGREQSWGSAYRVTMPITWLRKCDSCGRLGSPRKVCSRSDVFIPTRYGHKNKILEEGFYPGELCMSCANKLRPMVRAHAQQRELRFLINKLRTSISHVTKNHENG